MWKKTKMLGTVFVSLLSAPSAFAEGIEAPRIEIRGGVVFTDNESKVRLDSETLGEGTTINMEDDFAFDPTKSVLSLDGQYRFGESRRHYVSGSYFAINRSSTGTIDEVVQFGDEVVPINATLDSNLDIQVLKLGYNHVFSRSSEYEIAGYIGIQSNKIDVDLVEQGQSDSIGYSKDVLLPAIGIRGSRKLSDKLSVHASLDGMSIKLGERKGDLLDAKLALEYDVTDQFGVGLGYEFIKVDASKGDADFRPMLDWAHDGVSIYGIAKF